MKSIHPTLGKILYSLLFLVVLPGMLWFWAVFTEPIINLPAIISPKAGGILMLGGGLIMVWGMVALIQYGKGLPMNAYPPEQFVHQGPYRIFHHPIYWGFCIGLIGVFIYTGLASGLWFVAPIAILSLLALVLGYERLDLAIRFPKERLQTILDLPENTDAPSTARDKLISLAWLLLLLITVNFILSFLVGQTPILTGKPLDIFGELDNPLFQLLPLLYVAISPFLIRGKRVLRSWILGIIIAMAGLTFLALLYPAVGLSFMASNSLVLLSTPIFLLFLSIEKVARQRRSSRILLALVGIGLFIILLMYSRSAELHILLGVLLYLLGARYQVIWAFLRNRSEQIANSWQEWTFGNIRVINHGFYVGMGAFLGIFMAGWLAGSAYAWAILLFAVTVIIFSALWAQIIEGSEKLKRPYGYYGALVGIIFASLVVWLMGFKVWVIIGVVSVVMPWVQAIGRFRCLINGCCHGMKVENPLIGIRYYHPRSRVCGISNLKGETLHPTPLYSILWLFFVGFILLHLWNHAYPISFIFGLYLILTGLGRFVEEAYRGEVQTPILGKLRLYQWTALLSVIIGIVFTLIPVPVFALTPGFGWETFWAALIGGLFTTFAMGVDFPNSNARFSRLV